MTNPLLALLITLTAVSAVNAVCPSETGIYLMLKGECISNGTYFRDSDLQIVGGIQDGYIHCVLPNETLNGGQWLKPDGQPVDCINGVNESLSSTDPKLKDPFFCTDDSPNANITLYLENDDYFKPTAVIDEVSLADIIETEYKCCLPTDCSDANTNIMTINVFERVYIIDHYVVLPSDITVIPQYYTVHCIVTGSFDNATIKQYYDENSVFMLSSHTINGTELTQSYCNSQHDRYSCTVNSESITTDYTYDDTSNYTVTIEWEASVISEGPFRQSAYNGDHTHLCTANSTGAIRPHHKGRNNQITVRAPSSSPSIPILVTKTLTSITINWSYPDISDVDGYIVNASSLNDYVIQQVNNNSVSQTTLNELLPGTTYNITVRAYQDILGPPSDEESITTLDVSPMVSWSRLSPITNLHDTQYGIYCVTSIIAPTLIYWTVNGIKMNTTNYTLVDETNMSYNSTLLLYPNNELGQSVNVTCSVEGVRNESLILEVPSTSPQGVSITVLTNTSISISWSVPSNNDINGFIVAVTPNGTVTQFNSSVLQTTVTNLTPNTVYTIIVYSYKDLLSMNATHSVLTTVESSSTVSVTTTTTSTTTPATQSPSITTTSTPSEGSSLPIIAGGAIGGIVIVIVIVVVIIVLITVSRCRKNGNKDHHDKDVQLTKPDEFESKSNEVTNESFGLTEFNDNTEPVLSKESTIYDQVMTEPSSVTVPIETNEYERIYATPADITEVDDNFDNQIPSIHPINIQEFWNYVTKTPNEGFQQECKALYIGDGKPNNVAIASNNKLLNRFRNVTPYDENRVVLQKLDYEQCDGDYINASYIDGYSMARKFIAAQGPLKNTLVDFIRMIWLEKVQVIVMVTNLYEAGKSKCEQYWPSKEEDKKQYGPFTIKLRKEMNYPDYSLRAMEIKLGNERRHIVHYQLTSWPDHGVLEYPTPLILVHKRVMNEWSTVGGPLLVHCSAGVGRTGTFITLDIALEQANKEEIVDIAGIITRLRQQRTKMVQTEDQYIFIHDAVLEVLTCGNTEITSNTYISEVKELKQSVETSETGLQTQFRILSQVTPDPDDVIKETAESHPDKNRSDKYLPTDNHIVPLQERDGYISATFLKVYGKLHGMIIAQSPMENTVNDFWRMVMQYRVSAIVMCCGLIEEGEETCYQYWPSSDEPQVYGGYNIHKDSEMNENGIIARSIMIKSNENDSNLKVTQFQLTDWSSDGIVTSPETLLQVIENVIKVQQKTGGGPIVVHCSDTVSRSGVYCTVTNAIEQCKAEGLIDIFITVKLLRMNKPGAVNTLEQYSSVYDTVAAFIAANQVYANFR